MTELFEKRKLIMEYTSEEECACICKRGLFDCDICGYLEECYANAEIERNDEFNYSLAEAINYGGYESAEEFWNELFE